MREEKSLQSPDVRRRDGPETATFVPDFGNQQPIRPINGNAEQAVIAPPPTTMRTKKGSSGRLERGAGISSPKHQERSLARKAMESKRERPDRYKIVAFIPSPNNF